MMSNEKALFLLLLILAVVAASATIIACGDDDDDATDDDDDDNNAGDDDDSSTGDDDDTGGDDDDDDDEIPDCTANEICSRYLDECGQEFELSDCVDFYTNPTFCADPEGFHDCVCACLHNVTVDVYGEMMCDEFSNCDGACTINFCQ